MYPAEEGYEPPESQWKALEDWFSNNKDVPGLRVVSAFLKEFGQRANLELLDRFEVDDPPEEIDFLIDDASYVVMKRSLA